MELFANSMFFFIKQLKRKKTAFCQRLYGPSKVHKSYAPNFLLSIAQLVYCFKTLYKGRFLRYGIRGRGSFCVTFPNNNVIRENCNLNMTNSECE